MPTNLPPEYFEVEEKYRAAQTPAERIAYLEEMLSVIPKHKGTDKLRADLRRRLSKLKSVSETRRGASRQASPYHIDREGAGQAVVIGPANVGKSSLVAALTNATPEVGDYPYTTSRPTPGMMPIENIQVQLIDTPPLSPDFADPQLLDLVRRSDLVLLVVDLQAYPIEQYQNMLALLQERRIIPRPAESGQPAQPRASTRPVLVLVNKVDNERFDDDFEALCELLEDAECPFIPISATTRRNFDLLKQLVFERLDVIRIYSKPPSKEPDHSAPFVLKTGSTVADFATRVHKDFAQNLKSARVWGSSVFEGQMVGRDYVLHDGDTVELRT